MTILIPFNPAPNANFQFQCTLDGAPYNVICTFNAYGQRYYINVYDLTGTLILSRPIIASPFFYNVDLIDGFFEETMIFRETSQEFEIPGIPIPAGVTMVRNRPPTPAPTPPAPPPIPDFSGTPLSGAAPLTVSFTDETSGGIPTAWAWTFGDGGNSTEQNPIYTYGTGGSFTVSMTATIAGMGYPVSKPNYVVASAAPLSDAYAPYIVQTTVEDDGVYNAWPVITKLLDGRLMMGYTKTPNHHGTNISNVIVRFSTDLGVTWGSEFVAYNDPSKFSTVYGVSQSSTGRIFAGLWRDFWNVQRSAEAGLIYSDDNGVTWTDWIDLSAASEFTWQALTSGPVVQLSNGDLVITIEGSDIAQGEDNRSSKLIRSTDDGATWGNPVMIASYVADGRPYYESKIVRLAGANLRCIHRTADVAGNCYTNTSADNGYTWTTPVVAFPGDSAPSVTKMPNGELVIPTRSNTFPLAESCIIHVSRDSGVTWVTETTLDNTMWDTVYAAPVPISDDECLIVYSDQPTTAIDNADIKTGVLRLIFDPVSAFSLTGGTAVLQSANTVVATLSGNGSARSDIGHSSGHFYCEMLPVCGDAVFVIGVVTGSADLSSYPGHDANGYGYYAHDGTKYNNGSPGAYGATYFLGAVIGIEYNNGDITFYVNGVSQGVAFSGIVGNVYPAWGPGTVDPLLRTAVLNLGSNMPFRYPMPAGASSWV